MKASEAKLLAELNDLNSIIGQINEAVQEGKMEIVVDSMLETTKTYLLKQEYKIENILFTKHHDFSQTTYEVPAINVSW